MQGYVLVGGKLVSAGATCHRMLELGTLFLMQPGFRNSIAWQRAMDLAERVLHLTAAFPASERYGLTNQARRAAISVAANIAEGAGQGTRSSRSHYLAMTRGSLNELESHLELARRMGWISSEEHRTVQGSLEDVARLVAGLKRYVDRGRRDPRSPGSSGSASSS